MSKKSEFLTELEELFRRYDVKFENKIREVSISAESDIEIDLPEIITTTDINGDHATIIWHSIYLNRRPFDYEFNPERKEMKP